ncbi:MAG: phenylalanine--tRNA ligase subunit beta, partial [Thermomicrobiaceae bacterium]
MRWLRDLVPNDLTTEEIAERLTMAGLEAESIEKIGAMWEGVYVGHVQKVEQHPNADRLVLATVEAGEHRLTVVTGAPNIAKGQNVALAVNGAKLVDPYADEFKMITLKPSKLRGIRSEGMVCSEKELGLSEEHEGIMVLSDDAPIGTPLRDYLGEDVIDFEITPNLVHAFSMVGIARELAALIRGEATMPDFADLTSYEQTDSLVTIDAPDLCSRYIGIVVDNVKVEPSPDWIQRRLN